MISPKFPIGVAIKNNPNWRLGGKNVKKRKVAPRFELGMEALQASALPLGYATIATSPRKVPAYILGNNNRSREICEVWKI